MTTLVVHVVAIVIFRTGILANRPLEDSHFQMTQSLKIGKTFQAD